MPKSWNGKVSKSEFTRVNRDLKRYFRRTMPHASAEDLAADTWVRIIRSFEGRCSLRVFAFSVARWTGLDARRKHEREIVTTPLDDVKPVAKGPGPHRVLMLVTDHAMIELAVEQVDEIFRDVLRLWLAGRDNVQIAAELQMNYNTVRSQLHRAQRAVIAALRGKVDVDRAWRTNESVGANLSDVADSYSA
ncbi:RNA polymerase sigma factor [Enhygromyxa salina]|uniref:RNA polymerase sigma factor n=1 Tax=Enhygromyxa salina TaxID=215803 RepID=A0A2S9YQU4_9BACT|nr:RNA polymerase sigma factor [Enhygromyxa salina]PRQ07475.1 RNA polymerase sigma factor [Enhygromyxa salina]